MSAPPPNPVWVALDTADLDAALAVARSLRGAAGGIKAGLEFFAAHGPRGTARLVDLGLPLFLDLKFHDIPATVAGAANRAARLGVAMLTVHAAGGSAMLRAACDAARDGAAAAGLPPPAVVGVTVLTSLDDGDLEAVGQTGPVAAQVVRMAGLCRMAGCAGVVASAREVAALRAACGPGFRLVVPGLRPAGSGAGDQKRTMTPGAAAALGADVLVVGRPVTGARDPAAAAAAIAAEAAAARAA